MLHTEHVVAMVKLAIFVAVIAVIWFVTDVDAAEQAAANSRIEMTAVPTRLVQHQPPAGRAGDLERVRWQLHDRNGRPIGVGLFGCRWHRAFERVCSGVLWIGSGSRYGTIAVQGLSETRTLGVWAVTGGTEFYEDANGVLRYTATSFGKFTVVINY